MAASYLEWCPSSVSRILSDLPFEDDKFWSKVEFTNACWLWKGATNGKYGVYGKWKDGKSWNRYAHRVSWAETNGRVIPDGMTIDHLCFNKLCVNPGHLDCVTHTVNVRRAAARITHCPQGHEYTEENTRWYTQPKTGWTSKRCKMCDRLSKRKGR